MNLISEGFGRIMVHVAYVTGIGGRRGCWNGRNPEGEGKKTLSPLDRRVFSHSYNGDRQS